MNPAPFVATVYGPPPYEETRLVGTVRLRGRVLPDEMPEPWLARLAEAAAALWGGLDNVRLRLAQPDMAYQSRSGAFALDGLISALQDAMEPHDWELARGGIHSWGECPSAVHALRHFARLALAAAWGLSLHEGPRPLVVHDPETVKARLLRLNWSVLPRLRRSVEAELVLLAESLQSHKPVWFAAALPEAPCSP